MHSWVSFYACPLISSGYQFSFNSYSLSALETDVVDDIFSNLNQTNKSSPNQHFLTHQPSNRGIQKLTAIFVSLVGNAVCLKKLKICHIIFTMSFCNTSIHHRLYKKSFTEAIFNDNVMKMLSKYHYLSSSKALLKRRNKLKTSIQCMITQMI